MSLLLVDLRTCPGSRALGRTDPLFWLAPRDFIRPNLHKPVRKLVATQDIASSLPKRLCVSVKLSARRVGCVPCLSGAGT